MVFWGSTMQALIDRWFKIELIRSGENCPVYLFRWWLMTLLGGWKVYLHHFVGDDSARDLHDHPRAFISIGLWGGYTEETPYVDSRGSESTVLVNRKNYVAPWIRYFPPEHKHRLILFPGKRSTWTLVIVGPLKRSWGFWVRGKWIHYKTYLSSTEQLNRDC